MKIKKTLLTLVATTLVGVGLSTVSAPTSHASSFSKYITAHTWTMTADGSQGGYNGKTKFTDRTISTKDKTNHIKVTWQFHSLKQKGANTYYGVAKSHSSFNGKYNSSSTQSYMLKIKSKKELWLVPKHFRNVKGDYKGNSSFGATIFQLK